MSGPIAVTGSAGLSKPEPSGTAPVARPDAARKAAQEFEAMMLAQMFELMFDGLGADGMFGGGPTERTFRSFLLQEYATSVAVAGGVGIADQVYREIKAFYAREAEARDDVGKAL